MLIDIGKLTSAFASKLSQLPQRAVKLAKLNHVVYERSFISEAYGFLGVYLIKNLLSIRKRYLKRKSRGNLQTNCVNLLTLIHLITNTFTTIELLQAAMTQLDETKALNKCLFMKRFIPSAVQFQVN